MFRADFGGAVPSPPLVAAWLVLELLPLESVPWWAADWLARGSDGDALRELAGMGASDTRMISDLLPVVLDQMSVAVPASKADAAVPVFDDLARRCLAGEITERRVAQLVESIVTSADYSAAITDLPLGDVYRIEDAWSGGWRGTESELAAEVRAACVEQRTRPTGIWQDLA
jgi:hypothetical protein